MTYIIEFDYRSDNGPSHIGPFPTHEGAHQHTLDLRRTGWEAEYSIIQLAPVSESLRAHKAGGDEQ